MSGATGLEQAFQQTINVDVTVSIAVQRPMEIDDNLPAFLRIGEAERRACEAAVQHVHDLCKQAGVDSVYNMTTHSRCRNYFSYDDGKTEPNISQDFEYGDAVLLLFNPSVSRTAGFTGVVMEKTETGYNIALDYHGDTAVVNPEDLIHVTRDEIAQSPVDRDIVRKLKR